MGGQPVELGHDLQQFAWVARLLEPVLEAPPLRERIEDIPEIARHLLTKIGNDQKRKLSLTDMAQRRLANHEWPGNVRELENCLERAAVLSEDGKIDVDLIRFPSSRERTPPRPQRGLAAPAAVNPVSGANSEVVDIDDPNLSEKERVIAALEQAGWVQAKAARKNRADRTAANSSDIRRSPL